MWQKFSNVNQRFESRIAVTASNSFGFPSRFLQSEGLSDKKFVVIYYEPDRKAIGFRFTDDINETQKYHLLKSKKEYGGSVIASSFFKTYNIDSRSVNGKYEPKKESPEDVGDIYVIELKEHPPIEKTERVDTPPVG